MSDSTTEKELIESVINHLREHPDAWKLDGTGLYCKESTELSGLCINVYQGRGLCQFDSPDRCFRVPRSWRLKWKLWNAVIQWYMDVLSMNLRKH